MSQFDDAAARVRDGADAVVEARALVALLDDAEVIGLLDGDVPFWPGLTDMTSGGYYRHAWPAARNERLGIPGIAFTDGPRGVVVGNATCFPVAMARAATFDVALEEEVGRVIGLEARAVGATYFGGVCVNLLRHPGVGSRAGDLRRGSAPAGRDGCGADPRRAGARARVRQALRLQLDGERAVHRRRIGRRARPPRGVPAALPTGGARGRRQRHERVQLPQRRVGGPVVRRCSPACCATNGASRDSSSPTSSSACATRCSRSAPASTSRCRSRSSEPAPCRPRSRRARSRAPSSTCPPRASSPRCCASPSSSRARRRRRRCSPRRSTARWRVGPQRSRSSCSRTATISCPSTRGTWTGSRSSAGSRRYRTSATAVRRRSTRRTSSPRSTGCGRRSRTPRWCTPTPTRRSRPAPTWWSSSWATRRPMRASTSRARTPSCSRSSRRSTTHVWAGTRRCRRSRRHRRRWSSRPTRRRWHRAATAARCGWPTRTKG